eukprot:COSAG01_NODE_552_length_15569_cov_37.676123_12_plen_62_part_00
MRGDRGGTGADQCVAVVVIPRAPVHACSVMFYDLHTLQVKQYALKILLCAVHTAGANVGPT